MVKGEFTEVSCQLDEDGGLVHLVSKGVSVKIYLGFVAELRRGFGRVEIVMRDEGWQEILILKVNEKLLGVEVDEGIRLEDIRLGIRK
jgi:hypothetical protein